LACVYARTKAAFTEAMARIKRRTLAISYVSNIPPESYADFAFPYPRFGHITSNIVESLNGAWKTLRRLPLLWMLVTIWSTVMETFVGVEIGYKKILL
jgi:hypothetical protein